MLSHNFLNILVAEDNPATVTLLTKYLQKLGHEVRIATNGHEAIASYNEQQPDLVLTDINMPVINGIEAIKTIRQQNNDAWVPIIILSALGTEDNIIEGLDAGADDYLTKPINLSILSAKIKAMQRIVALQDSNKEVANALKKVNYDLKEEQVLAKKIADKMLSLGDMQHAAINYWLCPAAHFSGDLITVSHHIGDKLHVMLADSTGHGLAAALPTLTIANVFHTMSDKGFSISAISAEMNKTAERLLPRQHFVAIALFAIDFRHQTIECWNGGIPTALLIDESGEIIHQFKSSKLAIGILSPAQFDASTTLYQWQGKNELIIYSDGLTEAESIDGHAFGEAQLMSVLTNTMHGNRVNEVKQKVLDHIQCERGQDDISLLSVSCSATQ